MRSTEMQAEIDQLTEATRALGRERRKFTRLRAVVVKSLHPDHGAGSQEERLLRGEIFKQVWPEIERIESDA